MFINWDAADNKAAQLAARTFTSMTKGLVRTHFGMQNPSSSINPETLPHIMRMCIMCIDCNAAALAPCLALVLRLIIA